MTSNKAFYLTTPIYYVNDAPHIGHAYTTVAGDLMTRWHRMAGEDVWFLTGTDEHGQKVLRTAVANNVEPQAWADKLVEDAWLPVLDVIDAANDDFIRTTQPRHTQRVQRFLASLKDAGHIYEGSYEGPYCVGCEEFKLAGDLIAGEGDEKLCPIHSKPVEQISETNYFFKLSAFAKDLIAHYEANPQAIRPESAYNEVMSFLRSGLQDLSISRSTFDWGIDVPWDPSQVVYVWFDALLNYATAVGLGDEPGSAGAQKFAKTWPADVHLVGKDILRFHAVIWPAMLMAADLPLPKCVFAHGWLLVGGEKMSKSKLTGISPQSIVDLIGSDAFRYYFMRAIIFGQDGSFSWEDLVARYTAELANGLGNLASRVQAMVVKNFEGLLPAPGDLTAAEKVLTDLLVKTAEQADTSIRAFDFQTGIVAVKEFIDAVNLYVTEQEPWTLAKKEDEQSRLRLATILYTVCESLRAISILYSPLMPKSMAALWSDIGASESNIGKNFSDAAVWGQLVPGVKITKSESLFPRIEEPETI
ncbi:MAG: methionine--tRNA ligase [Candidatus Nanopelagicales bacterium]|jgi:methionyl-tRNA synthetase|nr:methionine--tRNA ligase [Candidatus Nanopelagicales bacterium]MDP4666498.1 methionine--tRNA ligase [Candidatus Nanopelagicales bacterium]MDP4896087.1 methionine--tRNA ligase [Candidatus Nanopelagicales bacterium]MDP5050273.1 methionine--tRNA ligase [Candidatus Nanopelagicales bacterium]